ncbi:MAG: hypothetical protein PWP07_1690 [Epulopiscium sp.]|jgi:hypothetical protein|uniref:hypothetical protein n=1 Tax=Defluviitalea raffinosedens TaxID=1450156 RepID=UPI001958915C|nr:hypothetical protein [Defluviitalea raffinosedens]MBM7685787.1 hypothetical protein [Defluviitalea raffinosedens]MBZ4668070.1 hypothetical protein [Defluviitaleaceae bacterium]MDK2788445.1 hypothetical protein [Candidatus Epulonipiscium sp.]
MSKFIKNIILGLSFTVVFSGAVFANDQSVEPMQKSLPVDTVKMEEAEGDVFIQIMEEDAPDAAVSHMAEEPAITEDILNKQKEIDQYLFGDYMKDIEEKGFTVSHTVPTEEYVEIGITPYTEENAQYLYSIFGKEQVKVVEGELAELYDSNAADSTVLETQATMVNEDDVQKEKQVKSLAIYGGGIIVIGGFLLARRKIKTSN